MRLSENHQLISLVVETTRKLFPGQGHFHLPKPGVTIPDFDYTGPNQRCCFCFSYRHRPALCRRTPALFASLDPDTLNSFGGLLATPLKDTHHPAQLSQSGSLQMKPTGGARTSHGHNTSGGSQRRHAGDENSGESSAQKKRRRNRPRHRSSHYSL